LAGASDALAEDGCALVGGHTCEGAEQALGFSVTGIVEDASKLLHKKGGRIGHKIVLTKPIGTGALFAADMRVECDGVHVKEALESMMQSNRKASQLACKYGSDVTSCTDVTGFGLVGHLLEMLMSNDNDDNVPTIGAALDLDAIPMLDGGLAASGKQIFSSLQKENAKSRRAVANHVEVAALEPVRYPLIFDPQTAGGLLLFVSPDKADEFVKELSSPDGGGYLSAAIIGDVVEFTQDDSDAGVCIIGSGSKTSGARLTVKHKKTN
jgi:selenide,water dikinase